MFWGKGDSSKLGPAERETLERLRRLEETGHITGLNPEQVLIALAAIKFYSSITATTGVLAGARNVSLWVGGCLVTWWAAKDFIIAFIKANAGG